MYDVGCVGNNQKSEIGHQTSDIIYGQREFRSVSLKGTSRCSLRFSRISFAAIFPISSKLVDMVVMPLSMIFFIGVSLYEMLPMSSPALRPNCIRHYISVTRSSSMTVIYTSPLLIFSFSILLITL